ncbi:MAG: BREX-1 system phosphatase PglZ type A [Bacteroidales bacterium]|nr:BREX-1 system phosphatase PglZ type A [Bacteroidales bacterium]
MTSNHKDKIQQILGEQVARHRLVWWYDPKGLMAEIADSLDLDGVEVLRLDGNEFGIKHRILRGEQPQTGFVVYSPNELPSDDDNWLLDLQLQGVMFSADYGSLHAAECGIPFELKRKVVDDHIKFFAEPRNRERLRQRISPKMTANDILRQMVAILAGTDANYTQITFALAEELLDDGIDKMGKLALCNLESTYWDEVCNAFGYNGARNLKDLLIVLFNDDMMRHLGEGHLANEAHIFMRDWRDSRQYGNAYRQWAERLEQELGIRQTLDEEPIERLLTIDTFPVVDKLIAQYLLPAVLDATISVDRMEDIIDERDNKLFFPVAQHTMKALLEARRMAEDIDRLMPDLVISSIEDGISRYAKDLHVIDMHYRHYFREAKEAGNNQFLMPVTEMVEKAYTNKYLSELARLWQPIVDSLGRWQAKGIKSQRDFFKTYVEPFIEREHRIYVIISDALRYETMVELQHYIEQENRMDATLHAPMLGMLPSFTQLGMAALLPNEEISFPKDSDEVFVDGLSSKGTDNRSKILCRKNSKSLAIKADDLLAMGNYKTYFKDFEVIYIYSNVIDKVGDNRETEGNVFAATETEFAHILKMVKAIRSGNGNNILITSDHGYLYQDEVVDEADFTDFKPVGDCIADTRRFVIGNHLQPDMAVKTWKSEDLGLAAGREVQIAKGLNRIRKQGAGSRFVHGGSMPQEVAVPVLHVNIRKASDISQVEVDILNQRSRLTSNTKVINFYQTEPVTQKVQPITLRIGFYDSKGNLLSDSPTLTFDNASKDSTQREQKHSFIFKNELARMNGREVTLRMERKIPNSEQFAPYKEVAYKVSVVFESEK